MLSDHQNPEIVILKLLDIKKKLNLVQARPVEAKKMMCFGRLRSRFKVGHMASYQIK